VKRLTGRQMCRLVVKHGWVLDRTSGSHFVYKKSGERNNVSVPVHGNDLLKIGTQKGIMKDAGLTESDL
jgi:predicted RNA binding protein YcfA (HicA-like mRNA interferase family)